MKKRALLIEGINPEIRTLAQDMLETMYDAKGIGLAAQQIGKTLSICVIDIPVEADINEASERQNPEIEMPLVLIDPELFHLSKQTDSREEGCLSFPEIMGSVVRPSEIKIRYVDLKGQVRQFQACGLLARAIQHEVDHLNGILFIERMSQVKRVSLSGRLKRMRKKTAESIKTGSV